MGYFGMDYYLFGVDADRQTTMAKRIIDHFEKDGYKHARFNWDGSRISGQGADDGYTVGEAGANAVACYALVNESSYQDKIKNNLKNAWNASLQTGRYRYYDGLVHYLSMLHLSGNFKIWKEAPKNILTKTVEASEYNGVTYDKETTIDSFEDCKLYKVTIKPSNTTNVEDVENNDAIVLMPNPAENFFVVKSAKEIDRIELINVVGQSVYSQANGNTVEIKLPAGAYIVKVTTVDGNISTQRLIVK